MYEAWNKDAEHCNKKTTETRLYCRESEENKNTHQRRMQSPAIAFKVDLELSDIISKCNRINNGLPLGYNSWPS